MLNTKIKILKYVLMLLFVVLVGKFLLVTIYYQDGYSSLAASQTNITLTNPMPRGEIFDRNSNLIVGNKEKKNLVYLGSDDMDDEKEWKVAQQISDNIDISKMKANFTENDYKDLIIRENYSKILDRVEANPEKYQSMELEESMYDVITKEDYNNIINEHGKDTVNLKILMDVSSTSNPQTLVENLTKDEQYYIKTNIGNLGGCFIVSDWERYYPYGNTMKTMLGSVGSIPEEDLQSYLNLGYSKSDEVGISYIEKEQEMYLKSVPQEVKLFYDENGNIINYKVINKGQEGKDIKLTIDIELQEEIEEVLEEHLKADSYKYYKTNYASVEDNETGELLAIAGEYEEDGKYYENSIGNFTTAYEVGSIVKPAVLLMGYEAGVWEWNQYVMDEPMDLGGGSTKASYHNYGNIDEYKAIKVSSNVYFYTIMLEIAGIDYTGPSSLPTEIEQKYFDYVRSSFAEFGLGAKTGIGFDNEIEGVKSSDRGVGLYMDIANGQYDTYTPLQVTQYMATMANGRNKMKINYLYSINEPGEVGGLGREIKNIQPEVLSVLDANTKDIEHVQDTLSMPSKSGGTTSSIADSRYEIGSKSGTSESYYYETGMKNAVKTDNSSFIAYAPYDNPNIAVSVITPYWTNDGAVNKSSATNIGGDILDLCYEKGYI